MTDKDLLYFKQWFSDYCASFRSLDSLDEEDRKNLVLKEEHTAHVCEYIISIAREESLSAKDTMIAEAVALFHDVGRFPQYAEYKTFRDSISVNHGDLGARVLADKGILDRLPMHEQKTITTAVKFHNAFRIPDIKKPDSILFLKLIRDADKLDIWRIFFQYYSVEERQRPSAVGLGFPDTPEYSGEVVTNIIAGKLIPLSMLKTLNDFKLTKIAWVYDLNFRASIKKAFEDHYVERIAATLPQADDIRRAVACVQGYMQRKLGITNG